jgi:hypothetical protein
MIKVCNVPNIWSSFNFCYEFFRVKHVEKKLTKPHSVKPSLQSAEHNDKAFLMLM